MVQWDSADTSRISSQILSLGYSLCGASQLLHIIHVGSTTDYLKFWFNNVYCEEKKSTQNVKQTFRIDFGWVFVQDLLCYYWADCEYKCFPLGIHLQFLNFSTEAIHDYLEIRSGSAEASSVIDRFSGPQVPESLFSTTHETSFFFHSDYSQNKPGFHITYQGELTFTLLSETWLLGIIWNLHMKCLH